MAGDMKIKVGGYGYDLEAGKRVFPKGDSEIDAHSVRAGDFTERVSFNGKTAYLTKEGKAAVDRLGAMGGFRFSIDTDFLGSFFPKAQAHSGSPK